MADPEHGNPRRNAELRPSPASEWPDRSPEWPVAPLAPVLAALVFGIIVDRTWAPFSTFTWSAGVVGFAAASAILIHRPLSTFLALIASLSALGGAYHHARCSDLAADDLAAVLDEVPRPAWVRGHIEEIVGRYVREGRGAGEPSRIRTRLTLRIAGISDGSAFRPASGLADVTLQGVRDDLSPGLPVQVAGRLATVAGPLNPGEFDRRAFLRTRGIRLAMGVDEPSGIMADPEGRWSWRAGALGAVRTWSRDRLVEGLSPSAAPLASALVLGRRDEIDPEVDEAFARTGTTHLLAVSGLQLQVTTVAIGLLLIVAGVPRRLRYVVVALTAIGYAMLVGASPSVVRSMVMTVTFCAALFASRQSRPADALSAAGILTLAVHPAFLFDVGCQLSFLAVGTLFWLLPAANAWIEAVRLRLVGPADPLDELEAMTATAAMKMRRSSIHYGTRLLAASAVVWAAAAPLSALQFHLVSPVGVLMNVPLVPTTSLALLAGVVKLAAAALGLAPIAWGAGWVVGILLGISERIARWGTAIPFGSWYTPGPSVGSTTLFYALLGAAVYLATAGPRRSDPSRGLRWARRAAWSLVAGWWLLVWPASGIGRAPASLEADVLAVGHGLAVVVQTPEGRAFLYDCGKMDDPDVGRRVIAPALWSRGISRLDAVFLSHADQDHFNGLAGVLDRFRVGEVVVPDGFRERDELATSALTAEVNARGVPLREAAAPSVWRSGTTRFEILHPPRRWAPDAPDNARSLTLDISHEGRRLLLTGDLELIGLAELLSQPAPDPPIEVLLSPHHGGRAANPPGLYDWARPRLVVVSQKTPVAGTADALTPLKERDIVLLRTWEAGAITLKWSRKGIVAQGFLDRRRPL